MDALGLAKQETEERFACAHACCLIRLRPISTHAQDLEESERKEVRKTRKLFDSPMHAGCAAHAGVSWPLCSSHGHCIRLKRQFCLICSSVGRELPCSTGVAFSSRSDKLDDALICLVD